MNVIKIICVRSFFQTDCLFFLYFHRPHFQWHEWENILYKIKRKFTFFTQETVLNEFPEHAVMIPTLNSFSKSR